MQETVVYVEEVKYSYIGLAVSSAMVMGGVLDLKILSGSALKEIKSGF